VHSQSATASQGTFLYDMDTVYNSPGYMWYTNRETNVVYKMNTAGTIIASYLATEGVAGVMAHPSDGGCYFIQGGNLTRLDSDGGVVGTFELPTAAISYVYGDWHDGFWLQQGETIVHLNPDGSEDFSIEVPNLYWFTVMDSGVITKEHTGATNIKPVASYISKYHKQIMRTWNYPQTEGGYSGTFDSNRFGARSHAYDDLVDDHASNFPIAIDDTWNTFTPWIKVSLRDFNFPANDYHQLRITLRADNSANSPIIYGIYTQRAIEVPDIYPNDYGKFYLKTDVSALTSEEVGSYTSDIRAYWFLEAD
jgi:hypothetical protein